jgi:signal transduction histidine kinase
MGWLISRLRVALQDHPRAADAVLAITLTGLGAVAGFLQPDDVASPTVLRIWLSVLSAAPLFWRRQAPLLVLVVVTAAQMVSELVSGAGAGWLGVVIAAYSLGAYASDRLRQIVGPIWWVAVVAFLIAGGVTEELNWLSVVLNSVLYAVCVEAGAGMRSRRERAAEMQRRAERAERERDLLATQRVQQERSRIARELHDVVAHSLSVIVLQAAGARRQLATDPEQAAEALSTIEASGREAMREMRQVLGVLRDHESTELAPQPSLAQLDELCAADPSMPVRLVVTGDAAELSHGAEVNAYRVVQEALTNVRRHGGTVGEVVVNVVVSGDLLEVEVIDDGRGAASAPPPTDHGFGLAGMAERVAAFGGEFSAGPRRGGGWRVRATFPAMP